MTTAPFTLQEGTTLVSGTVPHAGLIATTKDFVDRRLSPPIETPEGWLMIYHGVRQTASGCVRRIGLALFDREAPERCLVWLILTTEWM